MNTYSQLSLDWSRGSVAAQPSIIKRGNLAVLATAEFRDGQMVSAPVSRQRYVWPNPYRQTRSGVLSDRLYMR